MPFEASASDSNQPPEQLSYEWTDTINGSGPYEVSNELSPTLNLYYINTGGPYQPTTHDLALTVTNTSGKSSSVHLHLTIGWPCIG